jgi:hypothetical protein
MNKHFLYGFVVALTIISMVGCSSILNSNEGVFGKAQKKNEAADTRIKQVEKAQAQTDAQRLSSIGAFAKGGVEHSLDQIKTNIPQAVVVAKEMNARVEALANKPDFKEVEAIQKIVDQLLSEVDKTRADGEKALAAKDKELVKIQQLVKDLDSQRETEVAAALKLADQNAAKADQLTATLGQMDSWGGLGAIWYGAKRLITRLAWGLGIASVLFIILRFAAASNPFAKGIFDIFSRIGSWFIHIIEFIVPKAVEKAGHTATVIFDAYKSTLTKVVDAIEMAKTNAAASGKPIDINAILDELAKSMNADEKAIIEELKKALNWKQ